MIKVPPTVPQRPPVQRVDYNDISALTQRMIDTSEEMVSLSHSLANARTVKEYDSDRKKRSLALAVREFLSMGDSAAAAEIKGRASVKYGEDLENLCSDLAEAEAVISMFEAKFTQWKSLQSALSALRTISGNV